MMLVYSSFHDVPCLFSLMSKPCVFCELRRYFSKPLGSVVNPEKAQSTYQVPYSGVPSLIWANGYECNWTSADH